ncbi:MAG TPA: hypothetical protein DDY78_16490 [Planctomycetales bacterium]|nr:hypothetical protein [Planctomycetales bacterium]
MLPTGPVPAGGGVPSVPAATGAPHVPSLLRVDVAPNVKFVLATRPLPESEYWPITVRLEERLPLTACHVPSLFSVKCLPKL